MLMRSFMVSPVRVRFAPAPTGMMHLGNIRQALINFLFAKQHKGTFVLRIEDTDAQRIFDRDAQHIRADLAWLGITYNEGPGIGGPYAPYFQSERKPIYHEYLEKLKQSGDIYPCFCSTEELDRKRQRQIMLKQAPRYDRACLKLSPDVVAQKKADGTPYVWRFILKPEKITLQDLAHGTIDFDLANFSDFPLTRQDGSFTFIFANCIDDITMHITHIFRGEDHLSNSANQAMIYKALSTPLPCFWHAPIMCNNTGKKLSKRDFGFSLEDLRSAGFLPEAIINYLALIGAKTSTQEIMNVEELITTIDFNHHSATSTVRYDEAKLRWMNHAWIQRLSLPTLAERCRPLLEKHYPAVINMSTQELENLLVYIKSELHTLADTVPLLHAYFHTPAPDVQALTQQELPRYKNILQETIRLLESHHDAQEAVNYMKAQCKELQLPPKQLWSIIRIALTGAAEGTSIYNLLHIIKREDVLHRLQQL